MKQILLLSAVGLFTLSAMAQPQKQMRTMSRTITVDKDGQTREIAVDGDNVTVDGKPVQMYRTFKFKGDHESIPNLTDDQKKQIKDIRVAYAKDATKTKNLVREKRAHLQTLKGEDKPDMKAINQTIDEMTELQNKQMKARVEMQLKIRALLTDEQKVFFDNRQDSPKMDIGKRMMKKNERVRNS